MSVLFIRILPMRIVSKNTAPFLYTSIKVKIRGVLRSAVATASTLGYILPVSPTDLTRTPGLVFILSLQL